MNGNLSLFLLESLRSDDKDVGNLHILLEKTIISAHAFFILSVFVVFFVFLSCVFLLFFQRNIEISILNLYSVFFHETEVAL